MKLLVEVGEACMKFHVETVRDVASKRVQCDEIWAFCKAEEKIVPEEVKGVLGWGDVWTWTEIDADSKLIVSWFVGKRDAGYAFTFIRIG